MANLVWANTYISGYEMHNSVGIIVCSALALHNQKTVALNAEIDRLIAECHLVDCVWFCIRLTSYLKITFFKQYSRKYIKIIHQLVGHVYSLVPIAVADGRLLRDNSQTRHFAFWLCIKGDGALYLHMWYSTLVCDIVFVTLWPTGRSRVIKKFSSWSQSKISWPPMKQTISQHRTHTPFSTITKAAYQQTKALSL